MPKVWLILRCVATLTLIAARGADAAEPPEPDLDHLATKVTDLGNAVGTLKRDKLDRKVSDDHERALQEKLTSANQRLSELEGHSKQLSGQLNAITATLSDRIGQNREVTLLNVTHLDRFWLLISAALVFFMQAGFKCLEVGMVRRVHGNSTAMKNLLDWMVLSAAFFLFGFAFMYGPSWHGLIGTGLFAPTFEQMKVANPKFGLEFFLFQLAFAGTSATIVSGAMAERTAIVPYMLIALFTGGVIYPLIGHWCWGLDFRLDNVSGVSTGWLRKLGFVDFAGSTVVHSVGAWVSLVGVLMVGPRLKRFTRDGHVNDAPFRPYSLGYSVLGVFVLWLGWWGFNGGSLLKYDTNVSSIVLNTNIGGAFGGLIAFTHAAVRDREQSYAKLIGGTIGGLVAVTASCNVIDSTQAMLVGAIAGFVHNLSFDALRRLKIDDPVGAVPVHGACGVWGTICVGLFGNLSQLARLRQVPHVARLDQILLQLLGVATVFATTVVLSSIAILFLRATVGIRVSADEEEQGYEVGTPRRAA